MVEVVHLENKICSGGSTIESAVAYFGDVQDVFDKIFKNRIIQNEEN